MAQPLKHAVTVASEFFNSTYSEKDFRDVLLEEVESNGESWDVTIGYTRNVGVPPLVELVREYKIITIGPLGSVEGMRMREV